MFTLLVHTGNTVAIMRALLKSRKSQSFEQLLKALRKECIQVTLQAKGVTLF